METRPSNKECWLVYLFGTLAAFVIMRCGFSPSSMSMHLRPEYDLNIYYLIGQGWMQGRLPYVEFADLKGPLVFLLHGLGSLLTPGSFLGGCLLEAPLVGLGLLFAYRTVRLFLPTAASLGVLGLYSVSILYFSLHPGEITWVLQQISLFWLARWVVEEEELPAGAQWLLGFAVAVVLLVKYNQAAFWLPFCLWGMVAAGRDWWRAGLMQLLGGASLLVPVLGYFYAHGALIPLWKEYVEMACRYGSAPLGESQLFSLGWLLPSELVPLHLHQALPEWLAAIIGWLSLLPFLLLPRFWRGCREKIAYTVLFVSFALSAYAAYGGSHRYIHYAFVFSVYWLPGLVLLAQWKERLAKWGGAIVLVGVLAFATGLPIAVQYLMPHNGNKEMKAATHGLMRELSKGGMADVVILDTAGALHLHRLTGSVPIVTHFIPSMIPGGYAQHRSELAEAICKRTPRYVVGSASNEEADKKLLRSTTERYRELRHPELELPAFGAHARRPEYILYERESALPPPKTTY